MSQIARPTGLIIEGIMTTLGPGDTPPEARVNIAPMGPIVDESWSTFVFRPFKTSNTYRNLKAQGQGVFHVIDDVLLLARAAVSSVQPSEEFPVRRASQIEGLVLSQACRYHELTVMAVDDTQDRTTIHMKSVDRGHLREFTGFNRGKHAVLEAAILATRLHLTGSEPVLAEYVKLQVIVDKTGGPREHQAMAELWQHVRDFGAD